MNANQKRALAYRQRSFMNPGRFVEKIETRKNAPTVFLFRPLLNGLGGYTNLIERIRGSTNLFALRFPDELSIFGPDVFANVGRLYANAILTIEFDTPLYLVGWSFGGLFAFECARFLSSIGRSVESVILIEASPLTDEPIPSGPDERKRFFWQTYFENKLFKEDQIAVSSKYDFLALSDRKKFGLIRKHELSFPGPFVEPTNIRKEFRYVTDMLVAQSCYQAGGYNGRCYAISGDENLAIEEAWRNLPLSDLRTVRTRGGHVELMVHFAVEPVSKILDGSADTISSQNDAPPRL
jgi:thioesterase domain-containing protein